MMQATRFQRTLLFTREGNSANLNKLGQGPAAYDTTSNDKDNIGKKFAFTIPRSDRNIAMNSSKERKTPISYCDPAKQLSIMKKTGSKAIIGQYKQRFDVTKMNPINSQVWKKGLMF
jgi:hypothetical protein